MKILLKLSHLIDGISRFVGNTLIWFILAATLISAANAVARKVLNVGSNAFLEIQWYLFAAVFLIGAGHAFMQNAHIRIDVIANKMAKRIRIYIDIGGILIFLLPLCYFMIDFSWPLVKAAYDSSEVSSNFGGLLRWPVYALVPAGFLLLALQAVSELIKRIGYFADQSSCPLFYGEDAHSAHTDLDTSSAAKEAKSD